MMNQNVPHWNLEDDSTRLANPRKPNWLEEGGELVELLRQDGHLLTQSQNHHLKLSSAISGELKPVEEHRRCEQSLACSANLIGDDETESLFQYPLGDPLLEKDFTSEFFSEMAGIDVIGSVVGTPSASHQSTLHPREKTKPPPPQLKSSYFPMSSFGSHGAKLREKGCGSGSTVGGSSIPTIGSSICGSNQIHVAGERKEDSCIWLPSESKRKNSNEATSDCSFRTAGVQGEINQDQKRKRKDMHDLEYQSEQAEYEPTEGKKPSQRSTSTHRSRAAEVHNLSERRRRDRINEKMKTLQDLIPHCNKADKASMLEEAIEYLKSLQLQVQMMWMGRGMAQVMFPGGQQFMSGTSPLMHHAVNIPSFVGSSSSTNQTQLCPSQALNAVNFQSQRPSFHLQGSYAPYFGFHHFQPHPQAFMNPSTPLSNSVQQNRPTAAPGSSILPCSAGAPFENGNSKSG